MQTFTARICFILFSIIAVSSCNKDDAPWASDNASSLYDFKTLGGSTWVLTAYHDTIMTTNMTPNDTLVFIDDAHYTYNGVPCEYKYYYYRNSMQTHLELNNTPFGDLRGAVPETIETYGQINGVKFSSFTGVYYMWFEQR